MQIKLAEALLRRKELTAKVDQLQAIKQDGLFEIKVSRQSVSDSVDNVAVQVPKISMQQVTHNYDWHSKRLRLIDSAIQQANWTCDVQVADDMMDDYVDPYIKE